MKLNAKGIGMSEVEEPNPRAQMGGNNPPLSEILADTNKALITEIDPIAARANALIAKIKEGGGIIANEEQLGVVAEVVTDAKALAKRFENRRVEEKEPHLQACRDVDGFFATFKERLGRIDAVFVDLSTAYQRKKIADERAAADAAAKLRAEEDRLRAAADAAKRPATAERKHEQADEVAAQADAAEARAASTNHELTKVKTATGVTAGAKTEWTFRITDYEAIPLDKLRPYFKRDQVEAAIKAFVKIHKGAAALLGVNFEEDVKATFRR
jgi:hypothetical protein